MIKEEKWVHPAGHFPPHLSKLGVLSFTQLSQSGKCCFPHRCTYKSTLRCTLVEGTSVFSVSFFPHWPHYSVYICIEDNAVKMKVMQQSHFFTFIVPSANPKNRMPNSVWLRARRLNSAWISVMKRAAREESHDKAFYGGEEIDRERKAWETQGGGSTAE